MVSDFQEAVIDALKDESIHAKDYFGELKDPKKYKAPEDDKPIIYVNYTKDEPLQNNFIKSKFTFDLYVVHTAFSGHENTRKETHKDIFSVMQHIRSTLLLKSFNGSEEITLKKGEKIFDAPANGKYLTVYKRTFEVVLTQLAIQQKG